MTTVYDFEANTITGEPKSLSDYKGKVLLIVNTASKCGLTPQYEGLQALYEQYKGQGLEILGFPSNQFGQQEPGTNEEVQSFCKINYGVTFPLFAKTDVRDETAHPLFAYLTEAAPYQGEDAAESGNDNSIRWNFTKFLIGRDGQVVGRFEPRVVPNDIKPSIESLL
ncbi:glutathione peroxidase [Paenibacillus humicola]|uniref:glutathione peroxidase n=1 Tax=Paenibacillus humicola TaxID=3110540 RepID=UPI00237A79BC|nr:glutathione peroxidase [Paenibacillus humicola]